MPENVGNPAPTPDPTPRSSGSGWEIWVAATWCLISIVAGLAFITGTTDTIYGGDAYTAIVKGVNRTTRAVGFVIIGTGVIGLMAAGSRKARGR